MSNKDKNLSGACLDDVHNAGYDKLVRKAHLIMGSLLYLYSDVENISDIKNSERVYSRVNATFENLQVAINELQKDLRDHRDHVKHRVFISRKTTNNIKALAISEEKLWENATDDRPKEHGRFFTE